MCMCVCGLPHPGLQTVQWSNSTELLCPDWYQWDRSILCFFQLGGCIYGQGHCAYLLAINQILGNRYSRISTVSYFKSNQLTTLTPWTKFLPTWYNVWSQKGDGLLVTKRFPSVGDFHLVHTTRVQVVC